GFGVASAATAVPPRGDLVPISWRPRGDLLAIGSPPPAGRGTSGSPMPAAGDRRRRVASRGTRKTFVPFNTFSCHLRFHRHHYRMSIPRIREKCSESPPPPRPPGRSGPPEEE